MTWQGGRPVRPVEPEESVKLIMEAQHRETLLHAGWVPCSPAWLGEHPGECGTALRVAGGRRESHWHPRQTRRQVLREADHLLQLATVLQIPRPDAGHPPVELRLAPGHEDRWAICDLTGRVWDRKYGWMYEPPDETRCDPTRYTLEEAVPLARAIANGEIPGA